MSVFGQGMALFTVRVESDPGQFNATVPELEAGDPASSAAWQGRVARLQLRFDEALATYRSALAAALFISGEYVNVSAYPQLRIHIGDSEQELPLGDELFLDLFSLYAVGGWRDVEQVTARVAEWSGLPPETLIARERHLPGGVDLSRSVPLAAADFYRECRHLLAELVADCLRDIERTLVTGVRARLHGLDESIKGAIAGFGFREGGLEDPTLAVALHEYLGRLAAARAAIGRINAQLYTHQHGAPIGSPPTGPLRGGTGSDAIPTEDELRVALARECTLAVGAARALQENAPWALVVAGLMQPDTSLDDMVALLQQTLVGMREKMTAVRAALSHEGVFDAVLGPGADDAVARAYPHGLEAALVRHALEALGEDDYGAVHLLCERALVDMYEDEGTAVGIRSVVVGRLVQELLQVGAEAEAADVAREAAHDKAGLVNAVLGLLMFIPVGGLLGVGLRTISLLSDVAMVVFSGVAVSREIGKVDQLLMTDLADAGDVDLLHLGELLAVRKRLVDELEWTVLMMALARQAGRFRLLKSALFGRGFLMDVRTLMEAVDEMNGEAADVP